MTASKPPFPEFQAPPVAEVAIGVQFDPPITLTSAHLGGIWDVFREKLPKTQDQPPLPYIIEGPVESRGQLPLLRVMGAAPLPRCWFLNEGESELLQIQGDKFIRNWRK